MKRTNLLTKAFILVMALMGSVCSAWATVEAVDLTKGFSSGSNVTTVKGTDVTLTFDKGTAQNNSPKYYTSQTKGNAVRVYTGNTLTITVPSGLSIESVEFTLASGNTATLASTQFTPSDGIVSQNTWMASSTNKPNSLKYTAAAQTWIQKVTVNYGSGADPIPVTSVSLDKTVLGLKVGETETLTAVVAPSYATNKAVVWTSSNPSIASVENGIVAANSEGDAIITVTTVDGSKTATCQVTVMDDSTPLIEGGDYVKVTDASVLKAGDRILIVNESASVAMGDDNGNNRKVVNLTITNNRISEIKSSQVIILEGVPGAWNLQVGTDSYLYAGGGSSKNQLKTASKSVAGTNGDAAITITSSGDANIVFKGTATSNTIRYNSSNSPRIMSCYVSNKQKPVQIYRYEEPTLTVTITDKKYATFSSNNATDFSNTGITVYKGVYTGSSLKLVEIEDGIVPAKTGVVLYAVPNEYEIPFTITDAIFTDNDLKVSDGNVQGDGTVYCLSNGSKGVGFYRVATTVTVPVGKCYLEIPAQSGEARQFIGFDDETTTAISDYSASTVQDSPSVYNLRGQRVVQPQKGLYIVNGKKVVKE